jgi:hypothetical protein
LGAILLGVLGVSHYEGDEWYAQLLRPVFKSSVEGSELARNGPMVRQDVREDLKPAAHAVNA